MAADSRGLCLLLLVFVVSTHALHCRSSSLKDGCVSSSQYCYTISDETQTVAGCENDTAFDGHLREHPQIGSPSQICKSMVENRNGDFEDKGDYCSIFKESPATKRQQKADNKSPLLFCCCTTDNCNGKALSNRALSLIPASSIANGVASKDSAVEVSGDEAMSYGDDTFLGGVERFVRSTAKRIRRGIICEVLDYKCSEIGGPITQKLPEPGLHVDPMVVIVIVVSAVAVLLVVLVVVILVILVPKRRHRQADPEKSKPPTVSPAGAAPQPQQSLASTVPVTPLGPSPVLSPNRKSAENGRNRKSRETSYDSRERESAATEGADDYRRKKSREGGRKKKSTESSMMSEDETKKRTKYQTKNTSMLTTNNNCSRGPSCSQITTV